MDTLLMNGDHRLDSRGLPMTVEGDGELMQRALIRLCVRRGSLEGEPRLGSGLHKLGTQPTAKLAQLARSYVQEALLPMTELRVESVEVSRTSGDPLAVSVGVRRDSRPYLLQVEVA